MRPNRRPLRLVHTSDVHFGAYSGVDGTCSERRGLIEGAFARVIDLAVDSNADALLIAGDFFDNGRVGEETVVYAAEQIRRFDRPTFLLPGNHDPMDPGSLYWRYDLEAIAPRLRIVRQHAGAIIEPADLALVFLGRAY